MYPAGMTIYEARLQAVRRLIRTRFGGNKKAFAEALDMNPSYLSRMLKDEGEEGRKRIGEDMALRIEEVLGLAQGTLVNPKSSVRDHARLDEPQAQLAVHSVAEPRGEFLTPIYKRSLDEPVASRMDRRKGAGKVDLAVMDVRASMGQGIEQPSRDDVVMTMSVGEPWLRRHATFSSPDNLALVTGIGDSMNPTFEDGDPLLVDRGVTEIRLDAVYVLSLNDELYIKRVQRRPDGTIVMISDNKSYEPYHITNGERDKFRVLGRVVMVWNSRRI